MKLMKSASTITAIVAPRPSLKAASSMGRSISA